MNADMHGPQHCLKSKIPSLDVHVVGRTYFEYSNCAILPNPEATQSWALHQSNLAMGRNWLGPIALDCAHVASRCT